MPILIDGHNLIGQLSSISLQDPDDEEKLLRLLLSYQARTGKRITVVFDAGAPSALPQKWQQGKVEVIFARGSGDADTTIARRIRSSGDPGQWLVITSDRELAETVERSGARVLSAHDFAADLEAGLEPSNEGKDTPISSKEVEDWLALFGERE
ncbi:NYN domain-containing protein [Chloroflexota bacterium]